MAAASRSHATAPVIPNPREQFVIARRFSAVAIQCNVLAASAFLLLDCFATLAMTGTILPDPV